MKKYWLMSLSVLCGAQMALAASPAFSYEYKYNPGATSVDVDWGTLDEGEHVRRAPSADAISPEDDAMLAEMEAGHVSGAVAAVPPPLVEKPRKRLTQPFFSALSPPPVKQAAPAPVSPMPTAPAPAVIPAPRPAVVSAPAPAAPARPVVASPAAPAPPRKVEPAKAAVKMPVKPAPAPVISEARPAAQVRPVAPVKPPVESKPPVEAKSSASPVEPVRPVEVKSIVQPPEQHAETDDVISVDTTKSLSEDMPHNITAPFEPKAAPVAPKMVEKEPVTAAPVVAALDKGAPGQEAAPEMTAAKPASAAPEGAVAVPKVSDLTLEFDAGSSVITPAAQGKLDTVAAQMREAGDMRIQVRAYAGEGDDGQSSARRMSLSRALMVRAHLTDKGIKPSRIDVRALGAETDQLPKDRVDLVFVR